MAVNEINETMNAVKRAAPKSAIIDKFLFNRSCQYT